MSTEIASNNPGRSIFTYGLLDELQERYDLGRRETHEGIHALLDQLVDLDGTVIVDERVMRPELLVRNHNDLDQYTWITITDEAAADIRESFAATYAAQD